MVDIIDFGTGRYEDILKLQEDIFGSLIEGKKRKESRKETILIGEHPPVITLGRRADENNILAERKDLSAKGIETFKIGRGGDVTYHCPGQIILYPVIDLERHHLGVKDYVNLLEETVIRLLQLYDVKGERIDGATGVWIGKGGANERKISAIGIKCSRHCTMHGLSFNAICELNGFNLINPCGFKDRGVTALNQETSKTIDFETVKKEILHIFLGLIFPLEEVLYLSK